VLAEADVDGAGVTAEVKVAQRAARKLEAREVGKRALGESKALQANKGRGRK
jgi:hypothetical protein